MIYPTAVDLRQHGRGMRGIPAERFAQGYVVEPNGCWRWIKGRTTSGYGHFSVRGVYYQAHVIAYIIHVGRPPAGLEPDHLCRNRWCVNPADIQFVTHAVNAQRGAGSILSARQVRSIRAASRRGVGVRPLARRYGVHHSTISRVVHGLIWPAPAARVAKVAA